MVNTTETSEYITRQPLPTEFPLIDNDPHIKRVIKYARPGDFAFGAVGSLLGPGLMLLWEQVHPSRVGRGGFAPVFRASMAIGAGGGFFLFYQRSIMRFYGFVENSREVEMDMREMVQRVKKKEPLYGHSKLTPYMQSVATNNSRYAALMVHVIPWFNFVNHPYHGIDTAKYYQQAERELEADRVKGRTA